jgi:hypothetical protein
MNTNQCALFSSPFGMNLIGSPRIEVGSLVLRVSASTVARVGCCPARQTAAIASAITSVAA